MLWIDAICLNQNDNVEKAHQIGLMGGIYAKGATTDVWLGVGFPSTDRAMAFLSHSGFLDFFLDRSQNSEILFQEQSRFYAVYLYYLMSRCGLKRCMIPYDIECESKRWEGKASWPKFGTGYPGLSYRQRVTTQDLEKIFECTWIERIWTFQEIVMSPHPVVVCGIVQIPWEKFSMSTMVLLGMYETSFRTSKVRDWMTVIYARAQVAALQGLL